MTWQDSSKLEGVIEFTQAHPSVCILICNKRNPRWQRCSFVWVKSNPCPAGEHPSLTCSSNPFLAVPPNHPPNHTMKSASWSWQVEVGRNQSVTDVTENEGCGWQIWEHGSGSSESHTSFHGGSFWVELELVCFPWTDQSRATGERIQEPGTRRNGWGVSGLTHTPLRHRWNKQSEARSPVLWCTWADSPFSQRAPLRIMPDRLATKFRNPLTSFYFPVTFQALLSNFLLILKQWLSNFLLILKQCAKKKRAPKREHAEIKIF